MLIRAKKDLEDFLQLHNDIDAPNCTCPASKACEFHAMVYSKTVNSIRINVFTNPQVVGVDFQCCAGGLFPKPKGKLDFVRARNYRVSDGVMEKSH